MNFQLTLLQDLLFQSDKIYSVLAVILVIFGAVLYMLVRQERKLSRMESEIDKIDQTHS